MGGAPAAGVSVRRAVRADVSALVALPVLADPEHSMLLTRAVDDENALVLAAVDVAEPGAPVVGYLVVERRAFFGRDFVELLVVAGSHRRRGVGSALMSRALTEATTRSVFTSTNESNAAMRGLLDRDGWTFSGRLTGLDDGDPELVFFQEAHPTPAP